MQIAPAGRTIRRMILGGKPGVSADPAARGRIGSSRAAVLMVLLLILRLPLLNHPIPVNIDELYFMDGLGFPRQYPVHHPGYPLWVAMGTLLNQLGCEPYRSYQAWTLLASIVAPLLLYRGLRTVLEDDLAWWLALAFGLNPLVWFQSTTALSYLPACTLGLLVIGLCYRAVAAGRPAAVYAAATLLAASAFLRADLLIYLGPMVVYVALRNLRKGGGLALLILGAGCAGVLAVTAYLYNRTDLTQPHPSLSHTLDVVRGTSVFRLGLIDGLLRNAAKVAVNIGWDFGLGVVLLPWAIWHCHPRAAGQPEVRVFLLLWVLPLIAFLLLMHVVQGYFMLLLPAGYCAIGLALKSRCRGPIATRLAAALAICSFVQFALYPWSVESTGFKRLVDAKIGFQSSAGLRHIDRLPEIHQPGDFWRTAAYGREGTSATSTQRTPE